MVFMHRKYSTAIKNQLELMSVLFDTERQEVLQYDRVVVVELLVLRVVVPCGDFTLGMTHQG